jgi:phospholipase A1/A2
MDTSALTRLALLGVALQASGASAQLASCAAITGERERLACYDALAQRAPPGRADAPRAPVPPPGAQDASAPSAPTAPSASSAPTAPTALEERWELRPELRHGPFRLLPYRPLYLLVHGTTNTNDTPSSPTHPSPVQDITLQRVEAKLQLSFRTKLAEDMLGSATDVWFGYTQQSYWQAANSRFSSPFRETNYQPEFIAIHPLALDFGGVHLRYAALSFTHESNGRGESLSRSWNRLIGQLGVESGPWSLQLRPWARVFDATGARDDNPDIEDYVGRGELVAAYRANGHVFTLTGRHSLRGGERSRGSAQLDWAFPIAGALNGHVQLFSGYGESLIDYNHRQTTIGVGVSFFD